MIDQAEILVYLGSSNRLQAQGFLVLFDSKGEILRSLSFSGRFEMALQRSHRIGSLRLSKNGRRTRPKKGKCRKGDKQQAFQDEAEH